MAQKSRFPLFFVDFKFFHEAQLGKTSCASRSFFKPSCFSKRRKPNFLQSQKVNLLIKNKKAEGLEIDVSLAIYQSILQSLCALFPPPIQMQSASFSTKFSPEKAENSAQKYVPLCEIIDHKPSTKLN